MGWSLRVRTTTGSRSSFLHIHSDSVVSRIFHCVNPKLRPMSLNALLIGPGNFVPIEMLVFGKILEEILP